MKESGLNYFFDQLNLNTGSWKVLYTFEEGAGIQLNSLSGAQSRYSGILSSSDVFWGSPGSGYFSGNYAKVDHASELASTTWTQIYSFEKVNLSPAILFTSQLGSSGFSVGLTASNKVYLESFNQEPQVAASSNNYSSKNVVALTYQTNFLTISLFNFNSQTLEAETFSYPFQLAQSDDWRLGAGFTGYMDYFIHLTDAYSPSVIGQWLSGLYARPTGIGFNTQTICSTGITGYQAIVVMTTGVTGYGITPLGDEGQGFYTGAFPTNAVYGALTGIISSGLYYSGIAGTVCNVITGSQYDLLQYLTGYASSFNMQKVQLFDYVENSDIIKVETSRTPFYDIFNKAGLRQYSGYLIDPSYTTGQIDLFYNGVAQGTTGWSISGSYLYIIGSANSDWATFDLKVGNKTSFFVTGGFTGFAFNYSGQDIFLNGVNLISGRDFVVTAGTLNLFGPATGFDGIIFEYPIVLAYVTGSRAVFTGAPFQRGTSNIYFNGIRQIFDSQYVEGATFDLLSGNQFNPAQTDLVYDNTDLYWET